MDQSDKQFPRIMTWGLLQLAVLGIGASGFPFWAHHPFPRESLALQEMLVGQALVMALFSSVLIRSLWEIAAAVALTLPMDELAGMMSKLPQNSILLSYGCASIWLIGLGGLGQLRSVRQSTHTSLFACVGATLISVGGCIFDYFRWELAATNGQTAEFFPIGLLAKLARQPMGSESAIPWIQSSLPLCALTVTWIVQLSISIRRSSSTSLHPTP